MAAHDRVELLPMIRWKPCPPSRGTRTFPEAGPVFQGRVRMFPVEGYVFLYEHDPADGDVHVLDMIAPGQNWR